MKKWTKIIKPKKPNF